MASSDIEIQEIIDVLFEGFNGGDLPVRWRFYIKKKVREDYKSLVERADPQKREEIARKTYSRLAGETAKAFGVEALRDVPLTKNVTVGKADDVF